MSKHRSNAVAKLKWGVVARVFSCLVVLSAGAAAQSPVPQINQPLVPSTVTPGAAGFTLTVNGTGFVSGSEVNWNGSGRTTTFVSSIKLTGAILASDVAAAGTATVTVVSPSPGGGTSNPIYLEINNSTPSVSFVQTPFPTGAVPNTVGAADVNGDGKTDVITVNEGDDTVSVLLGNGDGTFGSAMSYPTDGVCEGLAVGDFNGDGNWTLPLSAKAVAWMCCWETETARLVRQPCFRQ